MLVSCQDNQIIVRSLKVNLRLVLLLLLILSSQHAYSRQIDANDMLDKATSLIKEDKYDSSLILIRQVRNSITDAINNPVYVRTFQIEAENYMNMSAYKKADSALTIGIGLLNQHTGNRSLIYADFYHSVSRNLGAQNQYDSSLAYEKKALDIWQSAYGDNHPALAKSYSQIGFNLRLKGFYDSALVVYNRAMNIYSETAGNYESELAGCYFDVGWVYAAKGQLGKALLWNEKSLKIRKALYGENNLNTGNVINMLGWCYNRMGYHIKALEFYKRSLNIRITKLGGSHPNVAASYLAIGSLYMELNQYEKAVQYLEEGSRLWIAKFGENDRALVRNYNFLAQVYEAKNDTLKAIEYLNKAIAVADNRLEKLHPELLHTYKLLAKQQKKQLTVEKQYESLSRAKEIAINSFGINHSNYGYILSDIAEFHKESDPETALMFHRKALNNLTKSLGPTHKGVALQHVLIGNIYEAQNDLNRSIIEYEKALVVDSSVSLSFLSNSVKINENLISVTALNKIGQVLLRQWLENEQDISILKKSLQTTEIAISLIEEIRKKYRTDADRQKLYEDAGKVYENGIDTAIKLYHVTGDQYYLNLGFHFSEKSKAFVLINSLNENIARKFADLPDSIFEKEQLLKAEISHLETRILRAKVAKDSQLTEAFQAELFRLNNDLETLQVNLEKDHPKYFKLKYNQDWLETDEIIKQLTDQKTAVLEFFVTDRIIHLFIITDEGISLKSIDNSLSLRTQISKLKEAISSFDLINNYSTIADRQYTESAYSLYQNLLSPSLQLLKPDTKNLIIISHGMLNQLNFEVLLTSKQDLSKKVDYASLPYLLKDYQISYAYSTNFLLKTDQLKKRNQSGMYAGFAPSINYQKTYSNSADSLTKLKYETFNQLTLPGAAKEVLETSSIVNGDRWIGEAATESLFKAKASQYNILHLATHGLINNDSPLLSELLFNRDSLNDGLLYVAEIYGLSLNAELAVLSACNTGVGKSTQGEGSMSISRAFSYAGCPSVMMSLWKIPDKTTGQLMFNLYQYLKTKAHKAASLRSAKLDYIASVENTDKAHPYYWAAIVLMGDHGEINIHNENNKYYWWIVAAVIILLGGISLRKKIIPQASR